MNEQEQIAAFETLCGGVDRAQRLLRIYRKSHGKGTAYDIVRGKGCTKEQAFIQNATKQGYSTKQCTVFLTTLCTIPINVIEEHSG